MRFLSIFWQTCLKLRETGYQNVRKSSSQWRSSLAFQKVQVGHYFECCAERNQANLDS